MLNRNQRFGKKGERMASRFLKKRGYEILETNYRSPFGEIDIIARYGKTIVFVEVKSRRTDRFGPPAGAVDRRKQERISKSALFYLKKHRLMNMPARFDVLGILSNGKTMDFELIENAFESSA